MQELSTKFDHNFHATNCTINLTLDCHGKQSLPYKLTRFQYDLLTLITLLEFKDFVMRHHSVLTETTLLCRNISYTTTLAPFHLQPYMCLKQTYGQFQYPICRPALIAQPRKIVRNVSTSKVNKDLI